MDVLSQGRIAGGQACPECDEPAGVAHNYCRWCGATLDGGEQA